MSEVSDVGIYVFQRSDKLSLKQNPAPQWAVRSLVEALGGVSVVVNKLKDFGFDAPVADTVAGWRRRDRAPGGWVLALLLIAEEEGIPVSLRKMMGPSPID